MANCVWDKLGLRTAINCQCNVLIEIQKLNIYRSTQWSGFDSLLYFLNVWEAGIPNCVSNLNFSPVIGGWSVGRTALWPLASYWSSLTPPGPRSSLWPRHGSRLRPWPGSEVPRPETERGEMSLWCPLASLASHQQGTLHSEAFSLPAKLKIIKSTFHFHTGCQFIKRRYFRAHVNWSYLFNSKFYMHSNYS